MMKKKALVHMGLLTSALLMACDEGTIHECFIGRDYCEDESTLVSCPNGRTKRITCDEGEICLKKGEHKASCEAVSCNPLTFKPKCIPGENKIRYCVNYKHVEYDCGEIEKYRCHESESGAMCEPQNESTALCTHGETRCSPVNSVKQRCEGEVWVDEPCPEHQQCNLGVCEDIPECIEGITRCEQDAINGHQIYKVCENGKWKSTPCGASDSCSNIEGCISRSNVPNVGDPCTSDSPGYCLGTNYYKCVDGKYVASPCHQDIGMSCQTLSSGDVCLTDFSATQCVGSNGEIVPCCSTTGSKIFDQTCYNGSFVYWECLILEGKPYAIEHEVESKCKAGNLQAYCSEGILKVQEQVCPRGCFDNGDGTARCEGTAMGDVCDPNTFQKGCVDVDTERACVNHVIAERACAEGEICRVTGCVNSKLEAGTACKEGEPSICVGNEILECKGGKYVASECSELTGNVCLQRSSGDICVKDISSMVCTNNGQPTDCCHGGSGTHILINECDGKVNYFECLVVNNTSYGILHEVNSVCNGSSRIYCPIGSNTLKKEECPKGCVPSSEGEGVVCHGNKPGDACSVGSFTPTCVDTVTLRSCNVGKIEDKKCASGEVCYGNGCIRTSTPAPGTACAEGDPSYCMDEEVIFTCVNGTYQMMSCGMGICKEPENGKAQCYDRANSCNGRPCCSSEYDIYYGTCSDGRYDYWRCVNLDGEFYGQHGNTSGICVNGNVSVLECPAPNATPDIRECEHGCFGGFDDAKCN